MLAGPRRSALRLGSAFRALQKYSDNSSIEQQAKGAWCGEDPGRLESTATANANGHWQRQRHGELSPVGPFVG
jgi:hypothetical protein